MAIAGQSSDQLLDALRQEVGKLEPGKLKNVSVYIMATDTYWPQMQEIFAKSGAKLVQINPERPIAQPPARLAELKRLGVYPREE